MKHLMMLFVLGVFCTVSVPEDCTVLRAEFKSKDRVYKASVDCAYEDGSMSTYWSSFKRERGMDKAAAVDYLPTGGLTDSITMQCSE